MQKRKQIRINSKEVYSQNNGFFITICTHNRKEFLSTIVPNPDILLDSNVELTQYGKIAQQEIISLTKTFENITLDAWVIMPNHIHAILVFYATPVSVFTKKETDLSNIIKRFKQETTRRFKGECGFAPTKQPPFWQKSFYDHVIGSEHDLQSIREYIQTNPAQWANDTLNPTSKPQDTLYCTPKL